MTLGFICSFVLMVFGILFYALLFVLKLAVGVNKGSFERNAIPDEEMFIRRIRASDKEYKRIFDEIMSHYKEDNRVRPYTQNYLIKEFKDDLFYIYGSNYKDEVSLDGFRARAGYFSEINFVNWFVALRLAKVGKAIPEWKDELRLNYGVEELVNRRICRRIEYYWNQKGLDVHLEQIGDGRLAYMKPSKFVYHLFDSPNYKWK